MHGGVDVTDEKLAVESIINAGPGGQFMTDPLTIKYLRGGEHYPEDSFVVCDPGEDKDSILHRLHERAEEIVASHQPAVPEDRLEEVRRYVADECAKRLTP